MNMKAIVPLGLAMVLGVVAIILVRSAIGPKSGGSHTSLNSVTVVVAKQDADPARALTAADLTTAKVPADAAPGQVFSNPDLLVGRVPRTPLVKGQAILETLLAPNGTGSGLQSLVPQGMRAVTIEVSEFTGVGGMLEPGCRVDVLSVLRTGDEKKNESVSKTILQNVLVTAVGRSTTPSKPADGQPTPPPANHVTLLVMPKQAQQLELACISARPWLVLRGTKDGQEVPLDGTTMAELRGDPANNGENTPDGFATNTQQVIPTPTAVIPAIAPEQPAATPAAPTVIRKTIRIIKGGVESTVTYTVPAPRPMTVETEKDDFVIPGPGNK